MFSIYKKVSNSPIFLVFAGVGMLFISWDIYHGTLEHFTVVLLSILFVVYGLGCIAEGISKVVKGSRKELAGRSSNG